MYVYIKSESCLWTVGFYSPDGKWNPESDHNTKESASQRVHYLNGGHTNEQTDGSWGKSINILRKHIRVNKRGYGISPK